MKRVLIFTETYHPVVGGGETQARVLAEGLLDRGWGVSVLTRRSAGELEKEETVGRVVVRRLPPVGRGQMKKWGLALSGIPALFRLRRDYDVVFVSGFRIIGAPAVLVAKALGKTVVLKADSQGEMSGAFFANGLKRIGLTPASLPFRLFLAIRNRILRRADACVAITDGIEEEFRAARVDPRRVHRVPNAVDTRRFAPASEEEKAGLREALGLPADDAIAIYTGRLVSYKGLPVLLEAWAELRRRRPGITLVLVGGGGLDIHNCEDELRRFVQENRLGESVVFTGNVGNVPDYLRASDLFVFPSRDDAFPSSLVEAMACRLPVVATPVGAMGTIVTHGESGLMVQPGDRDGLLKAMEALLSDPPLREALGKAGLQTVEARYGAGLVTARYLDLFESLQRPER